MNKTNAMRQLDRAKISYTPLCYEPDETDLSGVHVAEQIGLPPKKVFKTLAALGDKTGVAVFCIPSDKELDLKAAARLSGNKRVELLHVKDLPARTGYVRGGCSPIGMKKQYPTYFDKSCTQFETITISAGVKGCQLLLETKAVLSFTGAVCGDLIVST